MKHQGKKSSITRAKTQSQQHKLIDPLFTIDEASERAANDDEYIQHVSTTDQL